MFVDLIPWKTPEMEKLARIFLSEKKLILVRAPAGIGKTSVAIAYLFWNALMGKRGAIFLRTRREVEHALNIARSISEKVNADLLIIPTPSKRELCVMRLGEDIPIRFLCPAIDCDRLRRRKYSDVERILRGNIPRDMHGYIYTLTRGGKCPYLMLKALLPKADVIVGVHEYFSDPYLYSLLGDLDIAIIDEAHNFILMHREFDKKLLEKGRILVEEFYEKGGRNIGRLIVALWREGKREDAVAVSHYYQYSIADGIGRETDGKILKIPTPIDVVRKRIDGLKKLVVMSSTLYPSKFFEILFSKGIDHEMHIILGLVDNPNRQITFVPTELSTSHSDRNIYTYKQYAILIKKIKAQTQHKVIVFAPSYDVARGIARFLKAPVTDNPKGEDIIVTVFRGRIAEGVEIPKEYKVAIMAGLPYPKITKETIEILKVYSEEYGMSLSILRDAYLQSSMVSALIQAMGRVGRGGEKGYVFIIDRRAQRIFGG